MSRVFHIVGGPGTGRTTVAMGLARVYFKPGMQIVLHEEGGTYLFDGVRGWFDDAAPLPDQQAADAVASATFEFWVRDERDAFFVQPGERVLRTQYITTATAGLQPAAEA